MAIPASFLRKAPRVMDWLIRDFSLTPMHAAAILGNGGHESKGLTDLQEDAPTVKGSRGGWGWFQWTGPRRRKFEAWCKERVLGPSSDAANYGFLKYELDGEYKSSITKLKRQTSLRDAVVAFEASYEKAGVKHYPSRIKYAEAALNAWVKLNRAETLADDPLPERVASVVETDEPEPDDTKPHAAPVAAPKTGITQGAKIGLGATALGVFTQAWEMLSQAPETILQALIGMAHKPAFWAFVGTGAAIGFIWYRRSNMKKVQ
jgi:hypothetical protein